MRTELDEKQELICKIQKLNLSDVRKLKVFLTGMEIGKSLREREFENPYSFSSDFTSQLGTRES